MHITFFSNGLTMCFDSEGRQVPELQEPWLRLYLEFLEKKGFDPLQTTFELNDGSRVEPFKTDQDMWSWELQ